MLGDAREPAQVGEEHDHVLLTSVLMTGRRSGAGPDGGREERHDGDVLPGTELTGEAHRGGRAHALEHPELPGLRKRQRLGAAHHPNAAGGASPPAAASTAAPPNQASRLTVKPAKLWLTGISSMVLMLR